MHLRKGSRKDFLSEKGKKKEKSSQKKTPKSPDFKGKKIPEMVIFRQ